MNRNTTGDGAGIHPQLAMAGWKATRGIGKARSLIIKNDAASNGTDYVIAANNRYGPIINITAAGAAAVSGNTAASTVASTDPWANFSH